MTLTESTVPAARPQPVALFIVAVCLSLLVVGTYVRLYDPHYGWTKMINCGADFADQTLPRLRAHTHYVMEGSGNDGQFYAQMAIDPSLRDPAFDRALDNPPYRARRIGLPAISFGLGWAKPARVLQAYALGNLLFWFVLMGALIPLYRPWTGQQVGCFAVGLLSFGSVTSMEVSMVDLPAAAMIFVGMTMKNWGRYATFAAAALTRETSVLAAFGCLDLRRPFTTAVWKRQIGLLALAILPLGLWLVYVGYRFHGLQSSAGSGNFAFPLQAMFGRLAIGVSDFATLGLDDAAKSGPFGWLYLDYRVHELLTVIAFFAQGLYLVLRRDYQSAVWRTGAIYLALCVVLGPGVWGSTFAAARVLLPMTLCFYLLLARERNAWFWPFFILGSLSFPYGLHEFWTFS